MPMAALKEYVDEVAETPPGDPAPRTYGAAVRALDQAIAAIAADDVEARCAAVRVATEAIAASYLDLEIRHCPGAADRLNRLFATILGRLLRINLYNDPGMAREVIELIGPLRTASSGGSAPLQLHRRPAASK